MVSVRMRVLAESRHCTWTRKVNESLVAGMLTWHKTVVGAALALTVYLVVTFMLPVA